MLVVLLLTLFVFACGGLCALLIIGAAMSSARYTRDEERHQ